MSHWNHRVCKQTHPDDGIVSYDIREVYYNDDKEIWGVTIDEIGVYADTFDDDYTEQQILEQMNETIDRFKAAIQKPIVDLDTIKFVKYDNKTSE